jgi:hypothetical protein
MGKNAVLLGRLLGCFLRYATHLYQGGIEGDVLELD